MDRSTHNMSSSIQRQPTRIDLSVPETQVKKLNTIRVKAFKRLPSPKPKDSLPVLVQHRRPYDLKAIGKAYVKSLSPSVSDVDSGKGSSIIHDELPWIIRLKRKRRSTQTCRPTPRTVDEDLAKCLNRCLKVQTPLLSTRMVQSELGFRTSSSLTLPRVLGCSRLGEPKSNLSKFHSAENIRLAGAVDEVRVIN
ncbi:unnamed protein product [Dimorphilus gyrociliatus]|uniref:Uncharacterized protein n=1 Tax=Dimorphilus gyrociliatus TaxID=2664684 RepID=A0A7I8W9T0_9ANNE|nr:unnamed protein product [Dimorphilus gyrociliatus]